MGGEALGIFVHKVRHCFHGIARLSRDANGREVVNEVPESGDGRVPVNKVPWEPSDVKLCCILQCVQNGVANPGRLQADWCVLVSGRG